MTRQISFTKYEKKIVPDFRNKINSAESTEDVKKFFSQMLRSLFDEISGDKIAIDEEDIILKPGKNPPYTIGERLKNNPDFLRLWKDSDLSHLINKLAETASNRCKRLEKHPEKTDTKVSRRLENR